jgi:hypothetical protein
VPIVSVLCPGRALLNRLTSPHPPAAAPCAYPPRPHLPPLRPSSSDSRCWAACAAAWRWPPAAPCCRPWRRTRPSTRRAWRRGCCCEQERRRGRECELGCIEAVRRSCVRAFVAVARGVAVREALPGECWRLQVRDAPSAPRPATTALPTSSYSTQHPQQRCRLGQGRACSRLLQDSAESQASCGPDPALPPCQLGLPLSYSCSGSLHKTKQQRAAAFGEASVRSCAGCCSPPPSRQPCCAWLAGTCRLPRCQHQAS